MFLLQITATRALTNSYYMVEGMLSLKPLRKVFPIFKRSHQIELYGIPKLSICM